MYSSCGFATLEDDVKYEGETLNDCYHGYGARYRTDDMYYKGMFYVNQKEGRGFETFSDGSKFLGLYHCNVPFGPGVKIYKDDTCDVGLWKGYKMFRICSSLPVFPFLDELAFGHGLETENFTLDTTMTETSNQFSDYIRMFIGEDNEEDQSRVLTLLHDISLNVMSSVFFNKRLFDEVYLSSNSQFLEPPSTFYPVIKRKDDVSADGSKLLEFDIAKRAKKKTKSFPQMNNIVERKESSDHILLIDGSEAIKSVIAWNPSPVLMEMQNHCLKNPYVEHFLRFSIETIIKGNRSAFPNQGRLEVASAQLLNASVSGDALTILELFSKGDVHPDVADARGNTALLLAALHCHTEIIEILLDAGADVNQMNDDGITALFCCVLLYLPHTRLRYDFQHVLTLIENVIADHTYPIPEAGKYVESKDKKISEASVVRTISKVESQKCNSKQGDKVSTPIERSSNASIHSEKITTPTDDSDTYKYVRPSDSALKGAINLLISRGADPKLPSSDRSPILLALRCGDSELINGFLRSGSNVNGYINLKDLGSVTVLSLACCIEPSKVISLVQNVLDDGADGNLPLVLADSDGCEQGITALMLCICNHDEEVATKLVEMLLLKGADINAGCHKGHTAVTLAILKGYQTILELFEANFQTVKDHINEIGSVIALILFPPLDRLWSLDSRLKFMTWAVNGGADVVGPFQLGSDKKLGSLVDYLLYLFSKITPSGPDDKVALHNRQVILEKLLSLIQNQSKLMVLHNKSVTSLPPGEKSGTRVVWFGSQEELDDEQRPKQAPLGICCNCCKSFGLSLTLCQCRSVLYCGKQCQNAFWESGHKLDCFEV